MTCPRSCSQEVGEQDWSPPGAGLTKLPLPRRRVWGHAACKQAPFPEKENQGVEEAQLHSAECPQQETGRAPRRLPCSGPESISEHPQASLAPSRRWALGRAPGQASPGSAGLDTPQLQPQRSSGLALGTLQHWGWAPHQLHASPGQVLLAGSSPFQRSPGGHRQGRKWLKGAGRTFLRSAPHSSPPEPAASSAWQERKGPQGRGWWEQAFFCYFPTRGKAAVQGAEGRGQVEPGTGL